MLGSGAAIKSAIHFRKLDACVINMERVTSAAERSLQVGQLEIWEFLAGTTARTRREELQKWQQTDGNIISVHLKGRYAKCVYLQPIRSVLSCAVLWWHRWRPRHVRSATTKPLLSAGTGCATTFKVPVWYGIRLRSLMWGRNMRSRGFVTSFVLTSRMKVSR